jgi:hypothetical protein
MIRNKRPMKTPPTNCSRFNAGMDAPAGVIAIYFTY